MTVPRQCRHGDARILCPECSPKAARRELEAARKLCQIYFEISAAVIGEDAVRKIVANRVEQGGK
jgi:hypothetical protein